MLVEKIMTKDVVTITANTKVKEAERLMDANKIGRIVVVEEENPQQIVGIVTDGDLVYNQPEENMIKKVMVEDVITIYSDLSVQEAAQLLSDRGIGGVPVVDREENLVGIISAEDIVSGYVRDGEEGELSPEVAAIYVAMTQSREYEEYWLDKIKGYGYEVAITQTGAKAEDLPIKLRESSTVAAIARGVIEEELKEKIAVSNAVKDAYAQLNMINPGLGGGFKVSIVRGQDRVAVAIFGKFGHALVDGPDQLAVGISVV